MTELEQLRITAESCTVCRLAETRTPVVFGVGEPESELMFVGEAPGRNEDLEGVPFVGRAGQLLNGLLDEVGIPRETVYIANVLKCRPPRNRDPQAAEAAQCLPYLQRQLELVAPGVVLCVGRIAAQNLLGTDATLGSLRGRVHRLPGGQPVVVTYHPAYLLRTPADKRKAWDDLRFALKVLDDGARG